MTDLQRPPETTPNLYAQDGKGYDALVHAHYFIGANDWLVTEYSPTQDIAFGWACLNGDRQMAELGYVSLAELDAIRVRADLAGYTVALPVEYELDWTPLPLRDAIALLDARQGRSQG